MSWRRRLLCPFETFAPTYQTTLCCNVTWSEFRLSLLCKPRDVDTFPTSRIYNPGIWMAQEIWKIFLVVKYCTHLLNITTSRACFHSTQQENNSLLIASHIGATRSACTYCRRTGNIVCACVWSCVREVRFNMNMKGNGHHFEYGYYPTASLATLHP
jgi:hypothetical protein